MPKVISYLDCGCAILEEGGRVRCPSCAAALTASPTIKEQDFGFQELLEKRPKTQAEAMLCQAIAALSTQPQFSAMNPWEIFEYVKNTSQHWDEDEE